jgi:hypothetical protein
MKNNESDRYVYEKLNHNNNEKCISEDTSSTDSSDMEANEDVDAFNTYEQLSREVKNGDLSKEFIPYNEPIQTYGHTNNYHNIIKYHNNANNNQDSNKKIREINNTNNKNVENFKNVYSKYYINF